MRIARPATALAFLAVCSWNASAQTPAAPARGAQPLTLVWAPKPNASPFVAPDKAWWKLSEILAAHAGQKDWTEAIVHDA